MGDNFEGQQASLSHIQSLWRPKADADVPSTDQEKQKSFEIALKSKDDFENSLLELSKPQYKQAAGVDLSALFMPFSNKDRVGSIPFTDIDGLEEDEINVSRGCMITP